MEGVKSRHDLSWQCAVMRKNGSFRRRSQSQPDAGAGRLSGQARGNGTMEINGSTEPLTATNGRRIKFTPERLQQIKNLVERGLSREQIAETIGVTLGSLQVTCSRLGISLRRPRPSNGLPPQQSSDKPTMPDHRAKFALRMQYRARERINRCAFPQSERRRDGREADHCGRQG